MDLNVLKHGNNASRYNGRIVYHRRQSAFGQQQRPCWLIESYSSTISVIYTAFVAQPSPVRRMWTVQLHQRTVESAVQQRAGRRGLAIMCGRGFLHCGSRQGCVKKLFTPLRPCLRAVYGNSQWAVTLCHWKCNRRSMRYRLKWFIHQYGLKAGTERETNTQSPVCHVTHNMSSETENSFISTIVSRHCFLTASP